jgi:hypothetical protein
VLKTWRSGRAPAIVSSHFGLHAGAGGRSWPDSLPQWLCCQTSRTPLTLLGRVSTVSSNPSVPAPAFNLPYHPVTAEPAMGTVYRLTNGKLSIGHVPPASDWILPISKSMGVCTEPGSNEKRDCYGHSVYTEIQDLMKAQESNPWARKKSISSLTLTCGYLEKSSRNGDSHHDWWPQPLTHIPAAICVAEKR